MGPCRMRFGTTITILALGFAVVADPPFFWYKTFGLSDYESRGWSNMDLDVAVTHTALADAVAAHQSGMSSTDVVNDGYNDAAWNSDVTGKDAPINYSDFAVIHAHGNPPDCVQDLAPFVLEPLNPLPHSALQFGGWRYLKWLWAASCSWFALDSWSTNVQSWGTTTILYTPEGTLENPSPIALNANYQQSGVTVVDETTLSGCGNGDWYIRNCCFGHYSHKDLNKMIVKISAPGWERTGTVQLYLRECYGYAPYDEWLVGSFEVHGSMGYAQDYALQLSDCLEDHGLTASVYRASLKLKFVNCTADMTVNGVYFYYDPMIVPGITNEMQERVNCMGSAFQGCHAIMGYSAPTYASYAENAFSPFLDRWVDDGYDIRRSFFSSAGTKWDHYKSIVTAPAIAVAVGPSGDRYRYLNQTWAGAEDWLAPTGQCMISWCVPYFHNLINGYYWVEE